MSAKEKRKNEGSNFQAHIKYSCQDLGNFLQVEMVNFSEGGMCFESGYEIGPGTRIIIKRRGLRVDNAGSENNLGCPAEVKWCRHVPGKEAFFYQIGVQYIEPVNSSQCHEWCVEDKICILPGAPFETELPT